MLLSSLQTYCILNSFEIRITEVHLTFFCILFQKSSKVMVFDVIKKNNISQMLPSLQSMQSYSLRCQRLCIFHVTISVRSMRLSVIELLLFGRRPFIHSYLLSSSFHIISSILKPCDKAMKKMLFSRPLFLL